MNSINSPISLSQTGAEVKNLQESLSFLLREKVFNIDDYSLVNSLADEYANQLYGMATASLVKQFANANGMGETDGFEVDNAIAAALNTALGGVVPAKQYTVTGRIKHPSGKQLNASYPFKIFQVTYSGASNMTDGVTATDGSYKVSFAASLVQAGNTPGFKAVVTMTSDAGVVTHYESETVYTTATEIVLDINITDESLLLTTEYDEVTDALKVFVEDSFEAIDISSGTDSDLSKLVQATGESQQCIVAMVNAHRMAVTQLADVDIELMYGLLRQGITTNLEALIYEPDSRLINAINLSMVNYIIGTRTGTQIDNFIASLRGNITTALINGNASDVVNSALFRIIKNITGSADLTWNFLNTYNHFVSYPTTDLWTAVAATEGLSGYIPSFKAALTLAMLTGNNPALVNRLYHILTNTSMGSDPKITIPDTANPTPSLLTAVSKAKMQAIVTAARSANGGDFFYPDYVTGASTTEKDLDYGERVYRNFATAFPAEMIVGRLAADSGTVFTHLKSGLSSFMANNEHFDLRSTSVTDMKKDGTFSYSGITDKDAFISETGTMQRMLNLTNNYDFINAMAAKGVTSSVDVVQQPYHAFAADYVTTTGAAANKVSLADAATVYSSAYSNYTYLQVVAMTQLTDFTAGVTILDKRSYNPESAFADWRSLFGAIDSCSCATCTSVFSPSAYLVDTLNFFKTLATDTQVHDVLVQNRRPDIKDIELSCKNTNTLVPQIDIVNEMLEDLVSSVQHGILYISEDEHMNDNGAYKLYARQTIADQNYQRAIPEYVNTDIYEASYWDETTNTTKTVVLDTPYRTLRTGQEYLKSNTNPSYPILDSNNNRIIYDDVPRSSPWSLPYNFFKRQIDTHLELAGIKTHELIQRFSSLTPLAAWNDIDFLISYLGTSQEELTIYTSSLPLWTPWVAYGFIQGTANAYLKNIADPSEKGKSIGLLGHSDWLATITNRVDIFLQQTRMSYTELLTILDCYWINPLTTDATTHISTRLLNITPVAGAASDTCDLKLLKLAGFDGSTDAANNMRNVFHRFVRMARDLNWSFYELDRALIALNAFISGSTLPMIDNGVVSKLAQVKRVTELLGCSVDNALTLYAEINTAAYRNYSGSEPADLPSQYASIFRNPLLTSLKDVNYPFPEDPADLTSQAAISYSSFINYLSGVLNISISELDLLVKQWSPGTTVQPVLSFTTISGQVSLSSIYREVLMMKGLGLSASDWLFFKQYIADTTNFGQTDTGTYNAAANPFNGPFDTIRFWDFLNIYRSEGFTTTEGLYLMNDRPANNIEDATLTAALTTAIADLQTGLQQRMYPDYVAADDTDGEKLKQILLKQVDNNAATKLMEIVQRPANSSAASYTTADQQFVENELFSLLGIDGVTVFNALTQNPPSGNTHYKSAAADRRDFVYARVLRYVLKPFVLGFIAKQTGLNESMTDLLLDKCIAIGSNMGHDILMDRAFITQSATISRWDSSGNVNTDYKSVYSVFVLLQKATLLINKLRLDYTDIDYLWNKAALSDFVKLTDLKVRTNKDTAATGSVHYRSLIITLRWMQLCRFLGTNRVAFYNLVSNFGSKQQTEGLLADIFAMPQADIAALLGASTTNSPSGIFNLAYGSDYYLPYMYLRIIDCLEVQHLLPATLQSLGNARSAAVAPAAQKDAAVVTQMVKAKYDDATWLQVIKPVNDVLRLERRDAMVNWLLAHPPAGYEYTWSTPNDIFETLMVDVEMSPCMSTTRVVLATNTTQLWADRVLLGLEKKPDGSTLVMTKSMSRQWRAWRKWYRVWEANRRIFIYPENWIEPELRDGKSPFFEELEKYLKQNEVTNENVEAAYRAYLDRLDEVAHLDIIGLYRERGAVNTDFYNFNWTNDDVVHVFGRSRTNPHMYYYRKRVGYEWTPWQKMDLKIDAEHFIPMVWRGRLRLYWLVFTKDQQPDDGALTRSSKPFVAPTPVRWKIELAFTELKDGKWTTMQMGKDALYTEWMRANDPASKDEVKYFAGDGWQDFAWTFSDGLERLKKEWLNVYAEYDLEGNIKIMLRYKLPEMPNVFLAREACTAGGEFYNKTIEETIAQLKIYEATNPTRTYSSGLKGIYRSGWFRYTGHFLHKYNGVTAVPSNAVSNEDTTQSDYFYEDWLQDTQGNFRDYAHYKSYALEYTRYRYTDASSLGYSHYPDDGNHTGLKLLGKAPDMNDVENSNLTLKRTDKYKEGKYVVYPREVPKEYETYQFIKVPYFFYRDYKNQFFVEHTQVEETVKHTFNVVYTGSDIPVSSTKGVTFGGAATGRTSGRYSDTANQYPYDTVKQDLPATDKSWGVTDGKLYTYTTELVDKYRFHNFLYEKVDELKNALYLYGLDGLLDRNFITNLVDTIEFDARYLPTGNVDANHPLNKIDFAYDGAYAIYNWELFYHIPLLIANKLSQNQQFDEARSWYHYVFNPTLSGTSSMADFWNFPEFYKNATNVPTPLEILKDQNLAIAVNAWADDPFKPHLVARTRISAYMKNTVMKYLDNLIAWGDYLYTQDTRESINEAIMMYVLAAQIMGRAPETTPAPAKAAAYSYAELVDKSVGGLNAFGDAMVAIESLLLPSGTKPTVPGSTALGTMFYFCIPPNDKLYGYWDIVADRLFKIHNCQNINGVVQDLALFAPPIDPALLVKAAAAGVSVADAIAGLNAPMPLYRFNVMSQKATEIAQEVKSLGGQLLSALEKKDAEAIALLRSSQEITLLQAVTDVKTQQAEEAATQIESLNQQKVITTTRRDYYKNLVSNGLNVQEQLQLGGMTASLIMQTSASVIQAMSSGLTLLPHLILGPFSSGAGHGGDHLGSAADRTAKTLDMAASFLSAQSNIAGVKGSYERRRQEWDFQAKTADAELVQIDKQLTAAEIRKAIADVELQNHNLQTAQAQTLKDTMEGKYTNEELYDWMTGQIGIVYYQGYKLAMDTARKAERCFRYELGLSTSDYIQPAYWDSMKKGLLAAEQLVYDIKRMETGYLDKNKRQMELTKHVSLAALDPDKLTELRLNKSCNIKLPEWLYDLDYPGQYMRRIKSVSISIPCVAGPYTTVSCRLSLTGSKYRINDLLTGTNNTVYAELSDDPRFNYLQGNIQSIATSSAQNDSGMFEFNFRDERYLPFEGAGAISDWTIELPAAAAQFDYNSIADVLLHVKYTAVDGGNAIAAATRVKTIMAGITNTSGQVESPLYRIFDLKHEFADAWHQLLYGSHQMDLEALKQRLPYLVQAASSVTPISFEIVLGTTADTNVTVTQGSTSVSNGSAPNNMTGKGDYWQHVVNGSGFSLTQPISLKISKNTSPATPIQASELTNAWLVVNYHQ